MLYTKYNIKHFIVRDDLYHRCFTTGSNVSLGHISDVSYLTSLDTLGLGKT